mgnify:CR=1 FL=1
MPDLDEGCLGGQVAACHLVDDDHQAGAAAAELDKEAAIAAGEAEQTSYSSAAGEDETQGTLASDEALAALRDKLSGDE